MEMEISTQGASGTVTPKTSDQSVAPAAAAAPLSPPPTGPLNKSTPRYRLEQDVQDVDHHALTAESPSSAGTHETSGQSEHPDSPEQSVSTLGATQHVDSTAETIPATKIRDAPGAEPQPHPDNSQHADCNCHVCRGYVHLAQKLLKTLDDGKEEQKKEDGRHSLECLCRNCLATKLSQLESGKDRPESDYISYAVVYLDSANKFIKREPWPHNFDLAASRVLPGEQRKGTMVFSVTTILATTVPSTDNANWSQWEVERAMQIGILQNPSIRVMAKGTSLIIHSRAIMNALRSVVGYYPGVSLWNDEAEIKEPFCVIAHHLDTLKTHQASLCYAKEDSAFTESCEKLSVSQAVEHLSMLFTHVEGIYKDMLEQEKERYKRGMCTFHMLWYLFRPGATVYLQENHGNLSALVIQQIKVDPSILYDSVGDRPPIEVSLWYLDYDGQEVGRCSRIINIKPFYGEKRIMALDVYPCQYQGDIDGGKTRADLIKYGRRWYKYLAVDQMQYSGRLWNSGNREVRELTPPCLPNRWKKNGSF